MDIDLPFLLDLLRIPSVTQDAARVDECVDVLRAYLEAHGVACSVEQCGDRKALLDGADSTINPIPEYDYGVLRFYTNMVSRSGDLLATAIYSSWQDNNEYGLEMGEWIRVGDTLVRYMPADGAGLYEIKAAF